jgi:hypothetical protein
MCRATLRATGRAVQQMRTDSAAPAPSMPDLVPGTDSDVTDPGDMSMDDDPVPDACHPTHQPAPRDPDTDDPGGHGHAHPRPTAEPATTAGSKRPADNPGSGHTRTPARARTRSSVLGIAHDLLQPLRRDTPRVLVGGGKMAWALLTLIILPILTFLEQQANLPQLFRTHTTTRQEFVTARRQLLRQEGSRAKTSAHKRHLRWMKLRTRVEPLPDDQQKGRNRRKSTSRLLLLCSLLLLATASCASAMHLNPLDPQTTAWGLYAAHQCHPRQVMAAGTSAGHRA